MSKGELKRTAKLASERTDPISPTEDRMADVVCFTSHTLAQYWPPFTHRIYEQQFEAVLAASVASAAADDFQLRTAEAAFAMDAVLHHLGHSLW